MLAAFELASIHEFLLLPSSEEGTDQNYCSLNVVDEVVVPVVSSQYNGFIHSSASTEDITEDNPPCPTCVVLSVVLEQEGTIQDVDNVFTPKYGVVHYAQQ